MNNQECKKRLEIILEIISVNVNEPIALLNIPIALQQNTKAVVILLIAHMLKSTNEKKHIA